MRSPDYPNIYCAEHDKTAPGYMICKHVNGPADVDYFEAASKTNLGVVSCVVCADHHEDREYVLENYITACEDSLKIMGILPEGAVN